MTRPDGRLDVYLFGPKYKLDSESVTVEATRPRSSLRASSPRRSVTGAPLEGRRPKKVDIDKMHAYRDAIRVAGDELVVRYAAILYPGLTIRCTRPSRLCRPSRDRRWLWINDFANCWQIG